jgi:raffinose/stachyose/melibiose transport system substrate-binding protein
MEDYFMIFRFNCKRMFVAALAAGLLLSFAACGESGSTQGNGAGQPTDSQAQGSVATAADSVEKVVLSLRHQDVGASQEDQANSTLDAVDRFTKDFPDITVNVDALDQDTHRQKLRAEMAGGMPPDLFFAWGYAEGQPYYEAGRLMDISGALDADPEWRDGFVDGLLDAFQYGDGVYGIPRAGFIEGLFYNKEMFASMNIEPPKTYDELKTVIAACKDAGYIPIGLGNKEKWYGTFIHNFFFERTLGYDYFEKLLVRTPGVTWVNDDYLEGNRMIQELVKLGAFPDGVNAISRDEGAALFYQERAAMLVDGSWMCTQFSSDQAPEGFSDKVGFVNFPSFPNGKADQNTCIAGFTSGYAISADLAGTKKDAALTLLKYLNDDAMADYQFYTCRQIPNRQLADMDGQKAGQLFVECVNVLNASSAKLLPHTDVMPSGLMNVYYDISQGIFDLSMTPEQAMEKMEQASDEYLK